MSERHQIIRCVQDDLQAYCDCFLSLFKQSLVVLGTAELIARYNRALEALSIPTTKLSRIRVDSRGWSPEVAQECGDPFYLSAGMASPFGVVVSPDQSSAATLFPSYSFERQLLADYYSRYSAEIGDITTTDSITVDFDIGLSRITSCVDLLLLTQLHLRTSIGELEHRVQLQHSIVEQLLEDRFSWFNAKLRQKLIASASRDGDLRARKCRIEDREHALNCFYYRKFGGVFVLKHPNNRGCMLVLEDASERKNNLGPAHQTHTIGYVNLLSDLIDKGYVDLDLEWYRDNPALLEIKRDYLVANILAECRPEAKPDELDNSRIKRLLSSLGDKKVAVLDELERLIIRLRSSLPFRESELSSQLQKLLAEPSRQLSSTDALVVQALLARIDEIDLLRSAESDSVYFIESFLNHSDSKQRWVTHFLNRDKAKVEARP